VRFIIRVIILILVLRHVLGVVASSVFLLIFALVADVLFVLLRLRTVFLRVWFAARELLSISALTFSLRVLHLLALLTVAVRYLLRLVAFFIVCVAGDIFAFYLIAEFSRCNLK